MAPTRSNPIGPIKVATPVAGSIVYRFAGPGTPGEAMWPVARRTSTRTSDVLLVPLVNVALYVLSPLSVTALNVPNVVESVT